MQPFAEGFSWREGRRLEGLVSQFRTGLDECVEQDSFGRPRLKVTLPDRTALGSLAQTLARLMLAGGEAK